MRRTSRTNILEFVLQLLLMPILVFSIAACAYSVSVPIEAQRILVSFPLKDDLLNTKPLATSAFIGSQATISDTRSVLSRVKYSLGPSVTDDIETATQYLVEHESVREYPSPLPVEVPINALPKAKRAHPPLIPTRLTDDSLLKIVAEPPGASSSSRSSTMPPKVLVQPSMRSGRSFDINTAWIELLIHEQQTKLAPATTAMHAAVQ
jgi:hypothetical protein